MHAIPRLFMALACLAYVPSAFAYLDPGTGSILLQGLIAALAAVGAFFGTIRRYLSQWKARLFPKRRPEPTGEQERDP